MLNENDWNKGQFTFKGNNRGTFLEYENYDPTVGGAFLNKHFYSSTSPLCSYSQGFLRVLP